MLVLTRRLNEKVVIDNDISITILSIRGDSVRLGVLAPESITVDRSEVHERRSISVDNDSSAVAAAGTCT